MVGILPLARQAQGSQASPQVLWLGYALFGLIGLVALLFPWWQNRYYHYLGNRVAFGQHGFSYSGGSGPFYAMYFVAAAIVLGCGILLSGFGVLLSRMEGGGNLILGAVLAAAGYAAAVAYVLTVRNNLVYSRLSLDSVVLESKLRYRRMLYLYVTNTLAIFFSAGLAIPWAKIRMAHYRAETFTVTAPSLQAFTGAPGEGELATAEEVAEVFAWDFGL